MYVSPPDVKATEKFCRLLGERRRGRGTPLHPIQAQVLLDRRVHQLVGDQVSPAGHPIAFKDRLAVFETNSLRPIHENLHVVLKSLRNQMQ